VATEFVMKLYSC